MAHKEEKYDNEFDELFKQKKISSQLVRTALYTSCIIVVASLFFCAFMYRNAYSSIAVIDMNGEFLQVKIADKMAMQTATLKQTCANCAYYLNSFDNNGYEANYNAGLNYCQIEYANKITDVYKAEGFYKEALQRGVIFTTRLNRIIEIKAMNDGTATAKFNAVMEKKEGNFSSYFLIECEGTLKQVTPEYPNNVTGWRFTAYTQMIRPYNPDSDTEENN